MKLKAAVYCRLSEEDRNKPSETKDSESIQNQKSMLLDYAQTQNWEIYKIYSDDDYAGADRNRPEFNHLLEDAKEHKFDIVLCKTQSRFTRELELVEKYIHGLFPLWGIRFISIVDNADTANKGNKKSRQINGLVNEWYLEDMSENIRSVLTNKRKKGLHIGAFALYGYQKDPNQKGHLIIDKEAASIVREVFTLFSQGYGKTAIARMLNDRGIPNPTEYKRLHGLRYQHPKTINSTLWKYPAIADMLKNEIYIGNMVQGKYGSVSYKTKQNKPRPKSDWYRVEGTHEAIIDLELWNKVQHMRLQRAKPFQTGKIGLFAKKARCAHCGYVMRSSKSHGRHYLRCASRYASKNACIGSFISVDKLEELVIHELKYFLLENVDEEKVRQNIKLRRSPENQIFRLLSEISDYEKKTSEYAKGIRELYLDKAKGLISEKDFEEVFHDFTLEKNRLECILKNKKECLAEARKNTGSNDAVQEYTLFTHLNREMVEILIDHISVSRRSPDTGDVPIEIHWNF